MEFVLFLLVNAAMFLRPGEIAPALTFLPVYQILILACLVASSQKMVVQWSSRPATDRPISLCVIGLLFAVMASHLSHSNLPFALGTGVEFAKVVLYFLLLVAVVDSPARFRRFLLCLLAFISTMAVLTLLQYHQLIDIPSLKVLERLEIDPTTGDEEIILQLVGTGIFNDPNDLSMALASGILIGLYFLNDRRSGLGRILFVVPVALLGYALTRTQSRGGLLALMAGLEILLAHRLGTKKTVLLAMLVFPLVGVTLGGRFASMSMGEGTARERFELWRESMFLFRHSPFFGIGVNTLDAEIGLVAHNTFVHSYAEMGFMGGTLCVSMFYFAMRALHRIGGQPPEAIAPEFRGIGPYLLAILGCLFVGLCSLSRNYVTSTFIPIGMAEAYQCIVTADQSELLYRFDGRALASMLLLSVAFIVLIFAFIFFFVT